jgi:rhomboid protease GluP
LKAAVGAATLDNVLQQPVDVFRSARRRACDERAFVLTAVGIHNETEFVGDGYVVRVESIALAHAQHHLWQYEQERRVRPLPEVHDPPQPHAWLGAAFYALILLLLPLAVSADWFGRDLYPIGVMDPARIRGGELWRTLTALTLHWDAAHLLGNLGAGVLLGHAAAQVWGNARAWLLIVIAATGANLVEGLSGLSHYVSAGASTAVFAMLGLVSAHAWRMRRARSPAALRRWAPLVAGVVLLAMFGAGDPQADALSPTNVLSHGLGFGMGVLAGVTVATATGARVLQRLPDWMAGTLALVAPLLAWAVALGAAV